MKKKLLSILLCLSMVLSLLPATAMAASSTAPDEVYICGMRLTDGKCLASNEATSVSDYTDGALYVALYQDGILYLNGLNKTYEGTTSSRTLHWNFSYSGKHDLVIELVEGSVNTLVDTAYGAINGFNGSGAFGPSLTIQGKGTLNVTGGTNGIWVWTDIVIQNGATVNVTGNGTGNTTSSHHGGVCTNASGHGLTIRQGTTVNIFGENYGVSADNGATGKFTVLGGNLVIQGKKAALHKLGSDFGGNTVYVSNDVTGVGATEWDGTTALTTYKYISLSGFSNTVTTYDVHKGSIPNGQLDIDCPESMAGETITLTATADTGYELDTVKVYKTGNEAETIVVNGSGNVRTFTMPEHDVTAVATFKAISTYTVTYDANGGTGTVTDSNSPYTSGTTATVLAGTGLTKNGYSFTGWNTKADGTGTAYAAGASITVSGDVHLYAQWTATVAEHEHCVCGSNSCTSTGAGHGGIEWTKWTSTNSLPISAGSYYLANNITLSATWYVPGTVKLCLNGHEVTRSSSGVIFALGDNDSLSISDCGTSGKVYYSDSNVVGFSGSNATFNLYGGTLSAETANPVVDKDGTSGNIMNIYGGTVTGVEYPAIGTEAMTVNFYGGTVAATETNCVVVLESGKLNLCGNTTFECTAAYNHLKTYDAGTINAAGYTGGNLRILCDGLSVGDIVVKNVTDATAGKFSLSSNNNGYVLKRDGDNLKMAANTYGVTLNTNGGTINAGNVTSYTYGVGVTLPTNMTKSGYTFGGWYTNEACTGTAVTAIGTTETGAKTFWAKWNGSVKYAVTFVGGTGATGTAPTQADTAKDAKFNLPANTFAKTGYSFAGWNDGTNTYAAGYEYTMPAQTVTFTAQWTADTYDVTLNANGGTIAAGKDVTTYAYGVGATLPAPADMAKTGYSFVGWYDNSALTGTAVTKIETTDTGAKAYWAKWNANSYTVTLDAQGGTGTPATISVTYDQPYAGLVAPTRSGYNFSGWFTEAVGGTQVISSDIVKITANDTLYAHWALKSGAAMEDVAFTHGYDVYRDPDFPAKGDEIELYNHSNPLLDSGSTGAITGDWTLTEIGAYFYFKDTNTSNAEQKENLQSVVENIAENYPTITADEVIIHELKVNGTHVAYGVVVAYNVDAVEDTAYAVFLGDTWEDGAGYLLANKAQGDPTNVEATIVPSDIVEEVTYRIALDREGTYTFTGASAYYGAQAPVSVTVSNIGSAATGDLAVTLSGENADSFTLSKTTIADIAVSGSATFTVAPKIGMLADTYTATVTVSGTNVVSKSFDVSFEVKPYYGTVEGTYFVEIVEKEDMNGTVIADRTNAKKGETVTITAIPEAFAEVEKVIVKDRGGNIIEVTENADGTYSFKMPGSKVTVETIFSWDNPFVDVVEGTYYAPAVEWALNEGITGGTTAFTFAPNAACTRAQMVTFLWRAAGSPEPTTVVCPFTDVDMNSYYGKAVLWAIENGITKGTTDTTFSPYATCTRAHMATFLCRMAGGAVTGTANPFADVPVGAYYADPVQWAVENGVTNGTTETTYSPNATCTRGQMVTFLYRYFVK